MGIPSIQFLLERQGGKVRFRDDLRKQDAVDHTYGYRIHLASPNRGIPAGRYIGPEKKARRRGVAPLPFQVRRIERYELYGPNGDLLADEPSFKWAMIQAANHLFGGTVLP